MTLEELKQLQATSDQRYFNKTWGETKRGNVRFHSEPVEVGTAVLVSYSEHLPSRGRVHFVLHVTDRGRGTVVTEKVANREHAAQVIERKRAAYEATKSKPKKGRSKAPRTEDPESKTTQE